MLECWNHGFKMKILITGKQSYLYAHYIPDIMKSVTTERRHSTSSHRFYVTYRVSVIMDCENVISWPSETCLTSAYRQNVSMDVRVHRNLYMQNTVSQQCWFSRVNPAPKGHNGNLSLQTWNNTIICSLFHFHPAECSHVRSQIVTCEQ